MTRSLLFLLAGALLIVPASRTHGQSLPPAAATATPAATPDPQALMQQAYANQPAQGAVHWRETTTYRTPKQSRETDWTVGDLSWRDTLLHQVTTARTTNLHKKPNTTTTSKTIDLIARGVLAERTDKQPWDCSAVDFSSASVAGSGSDSGDLSSVLTGTASFTETNLGLETLNGVPVWHLRETMAIPGGTPQGHPGVGDYYISEADEIPLREVVSLTMLFPVPWSGSSVRTVKVIEHSTLDYTNYGETFGVTLPKACRGTQAAAQRAGRAGERHSLWAGIVGRAERFARTSSRGAAITRR